MKTKLFFILAMGIVALGTNAQAPIIEWQQSYGGTGSDIAKSIKQTKDGGYIVIGSTLSTEGNVTGNHGGSDIWVIKIASTGKIEWQKTIGGTALDEGNDVVQTKDGGYAIVGYTLSTNGDITGNHGGGDAVVAKLDATGTIKWIKEYGGTNRERGMGIYNTNDGGFVFNAGTMSNDGQVTGHHGAAGTEDAWVVKLDSLGTLLWNKCIGGSGADASNTPTSIVQTADHGYFFAGHTASTDGDITGNHGPDDWLLAKLDSAGTKEWAKPFGGPIEEDPATSVCQTKDGGFIIIGNANSNSGQVSGHHGTAGASNDIWVVKITATGTIQWQKSLGGTGEDNAEPGSISLTANGGYIISGTSSSKDGDVTGNHGGSDYWLVQIDSVGTIKWQKSLGGTGLEVSGTTVQTTDKGFIIAGAGTTNSGDITGNHGGNDFWIVKLSAATGIETIEATTNKVVVYPNPSDGIFTLKSVSKISKIEVMNTLGEKIYSTDVNSDTTQVNLNNEAKGIYFYTLFNNETIIGRGRLILQ